MKLFAPHMKDFYKVGHKPQYATGTDFVYSNLTARNGKHSNIPSGTGITLIGTQYVVINILIDVWNKSFFSKSKNEVCAKYARRVSNGLGYKVNIEHIEALHDLGYLPVEVRALPEGSFVPYGIPMLTINNTLPEFFWVTNMLETVLSAELWGILTSATTYNEYRKNFIKYAKLTGGDLNFVPFQAHDFSARGMFGIVAGAMSGFGALAAGSYGTDTILAIDLAEEYYGANSDIEMVGGSVNATEHSIMCSGTQEGEFSTYQRLINEIYPEGILSIVSDTWDFWNVVTNFLPLLKDDIMARDGKVVIRPDSGDPVEILCGKNYKSIGMKCSTLDEWKEYAGDEIDMNFRDELDAESPHYVQSEIFKSPFGVFSVTYEPDLNRHDKRFYYVDNDSSTVSYCKFTKINESPQSKGLIECLWDIFGGTIVSGSNGKQYKLLDSHIGAIYGDSITLNRQLEILENLEKKGFCSSNIVLGTGSYTYQHVTRDTHGTAMKATYVEIDGVGRDIFKDPKTDDGTKKSAKGLMMVQSYDDGKHLKLVQGVTRLESTKGALELIFKDGVMVKTVTLDEIRKRVASYDD